jgi:hypothetical protein
MMRRWGKVALGLALALGGGALLAALDGQARFWPGWPAYSLLLALGVAGLLWSRRLIKAERAVQAAAWTAFWLRLVVGVALMLLLPTAGYQDNRVSQAGYLYEDAYARDREAYDLSLTDQPALSAFSGQMKGDQYGGTLALSILVYRYLSSDVHRPFLILILGAAAAAWGVLALGRAGAEWLGGAAGTLAGWTLALYPEAVLLGSTHMREALVIPAVALTALGLAEVLAKERRGWAWLALGEGLLLLLQPPAALFGLLIVAGLWFFAPQQHRSWKILAVFAGVLVGLALLVTVIWGSLPALQGRGALGTLASWLESNFYYQARLAIQQSGHLQALTRRLGEVFTLPIILVYGLAQPVLPAILTADAPAIWRLVGTLRAAGWYALAPFLIYGLLASWRGLRDQRRVYLAWLAAILWTWIAIAALNAGGDQWDNPRYRTIFLAWEALLAAWALLWARQRRAVWLGRWLILEGVFLLAFLEWYITRYTLKFLHVSNLLIMGGLVLAVCGLLLGWWLWRDWQARKQG